MEKDGSCKGTPMLVSVVIVPNHQRNQIQGQQPQKNRKDKTSNCGYYGILCIYERLSLQHVP